MIEKSSLGSMVMRMLKVANKTENYVRFIEEINDRLDFVYNHPVMNDVRKLQQNPKYLKLERIIIDGPKYGITESGKEEGKFYFLNIQNISDFGYVLIKDVNKIGNASEEYLLTKGDILISRSRLVGKVGLVREKVEDTTYGSYLLRIKINEDRYDSTFLVYFLNSSIGQKQFLLLRTGSSGENINAEQIKKIMIPNINKKYQLEIIDVVQPTMDEIKKTINEIDMNREKLYQRILEELDIFHVRTEMNRNKENYFFKSGSEGATLDFYKFPDELEERLHYLFYHPKYEILEELKKKYKLVKLKEIVREPIIRGEQPEYSEEGITIIKTVDLKNGYIDYENCLKVSEEFFENYKKQHSEGVLKKGDILIASTGYVSMGKIDIYDRDEPAMASVDLLILRVDTEKYDPYFIAYYLRSHLGQIQFDKWWSGSSGQIEIQPQDLDEILIPESSEDGIPLEKQKEIAEEITKKLNKLFEKEKQAMEKWEEAKKLFEKLVLEGIDDEAAE